MTLETVVYQDYEQTLITIVRSLPLNRVQQIVEYAKFMEAQILTEKLMEEETAAEIEADNARWDALVATDRSQKLLEQLANEALAEHRAGRTTPMIFKKDGQLGPE